MYIRLRVSELQEGAATATPASSPIAPAAPPPAAAPLPPPPPAAKVPARGPKGVGGWLLFFCVLLTILSPLYTGSQLAGSYFRLKGAFPQHPTFEVALILTSVCLAAAVIYGMSVGSRIWSASPDGRRLAQQYL